MMKAEEQFERESVLRVFEKGQYGGRIHESISPHPPLLQRELAQVNNNRNPNTNAKRHSYQFADNRKHLI